MATLKPLPLPAGAVVAAVVSAAMIAQQVAGKAARDALFLSSFKVTALPSMMAASAVLSLFAALWLSKLMVRHSPAKIVPASFAVFGVALLAEWALSFPMPRLAAVVVYFHTALFGASVISAFWSFINEKFDPHTGKRAVTWIAGGGTLGGVVGGVLAWRAASFIAVPTMLLLLAAFNVVCLWGSLRLRDPKTPEAEAASAQRRAQAERPSHEHAPDLSPFQVLRDAPYLQNLTLVVAFGAITSGVLDYVFSAEAARVYSKGPELLSFFALFWLAVGVLSFALQMLFGRIALEKLGLAVTVALLPGVVVLGGAFGLAVPGLLSVSILRGGEAAQRNSLFRAAYELLYTPLSEQKKRSTKMLIDVGFDRFGTVAASGIVMVTLELAGNPKLANLILLAVAIGCALVTIARSRPLHTGYVTVLEESLKKEAAKMRPSSYSHARLSSHEDLAVRDEIVAKQQDLPRTEALAALSTRISEANAATEPLLCAAQAVAADAQAILRQSLRDAKRLCSDNPYDVRGVLSAEAPLAPPLVFFAIALLASKDFHQDAIAALRKVAAKTTGQLSDALCDSTTAFHVRRRIPRVLAACETQVAADALIRGTTDERFEVRFECGRALLRMTSASPSIEISLATVLEIVKREVAISKEIWESQPPPEFDDEESDPPALVDRLLRDRIDRSLEHVFTILALVIDRESLRLAFKAVHHEDMRLRGTALEYLETVLPDEVRDAVWPFLGEDRPMRPARPAKEILADLVGARNGGPPERA